MKCAATVTLEKPRTQGGIEQYTQIVLVCGRSNYGRRAEGAAAKCETKCSGGAPRREGNGTNGHSRSACKGVKHDLFSRELVFTLAADREEFERLLRELFADCDPQGAREQELVLDLVYCRWRKRRLLRWELAELHRQYDRYKPILRTELEQKFRINLTGAQLSGSPEYLKHSTHGLAHLREVLEQIQREAEEIGYLSPPAEEQLVSNFGMAEGSVAARCITISKMASETGATNSTLKQDILHTLAQESSHLGLLKDIAAEAESRSIELRETSLSGIPRETLGRMQRYETSVDRQFGRLLDQLEHLQRYRKGELVAPPLKIALSQEGYW
jgi:hypothetical protein